MSINSVFFTALLNQVNDLWQKQYGTENVTYSQPNDKFSVPFLCMNNQFYYIIKLPGFHLQYVSPSLKTTLPNLSEINDLIETYEIIHPDDYRNVLLNNINLYEYAIYNYKYLKSLDCLTSLNYRIKYAPDAYININSQTCVYKKNRDKKNLSFLTLITDMSNARNAINPCFPQNGETINKSNRKNIVHGIFTERELEILSFLTIGKSSTEIANLLNISRHTVDTHRRKMLSKSNLGSTAELVAYTMTKV